MPKKHMTACLLRYVVLLLVTLVNLDIAAVQVVSLILAGEIRCVVFFT
jgi:hypothetical protein